MRRRRDQMRGGAGRAGLAAWLALGTFLLAAAPAGGASPLGGPPGEPSRAGRTLTSQTGGWLCLPGPCSYSYAWQRCTPGCDTVGAATGPAYLLTTADIGARIRSVVTAQDGVGSDSQFSVPTDPVPAAPPVNTAPPTAAGTPQVGRTLTSAPGSWDDPSPGSVTYSRHWLRCTTIEAASCLPVSTAPTYVPGNADVGRFIRRREIAEGLGSAAAFSTPIGTIAALPARAPFSSIGAGSTPPAGSTGARRLRPFPVVVISGSVRGRFTLIRRLVVRGPRRARVRLRCRGSGCRFRRISHTIGRRKRVRVRGAEGSYPRGSFIDIRVTGRNRIGKFTRIRFRSRRAPARRDLCLQPGASRPSRC